jgi:succinoglycan biosynthesis protein ExoM
LLWCRLYGAIGSVIRLYGDLLRAKYSLCIPTFMRPQNLDVLLQCIAHQKWKPNSSDLEIIIADNDVSKSAKWVVEKWESLMPYSINYIVVECRGLANIRNTLLDTAKNENIILLDDDQSVPEDFLKFLDEKWTRRATDVIAAYFNVKPLIELGFPEYLRDMITFSYSRKEMFESKEIASCGTNGAVILLSVVRANNIRFDVRFNSIGGEDTQFFLDVRKFGKIVNLPSVIAFERFSLERANLCYWILNAFNRGATYSVIQLRRKNYSSMIKIFNVSTIATLIGPFFSPLLLVLPFGRGAFYLVLYFRQIGKLVGLTGYAPKFYANLGVKRKMAD